MTIQHTALHERHLSADGHMVDFAGFRMPTYYTSIVEEHKAVRARGGVFDVSHMGEFFVSGPDAESFLNRMTVNNVTKLVDGQVQYSAMMTPEGGIVDDLLVHRIDQEHFMLVVNASNRQKDFDWLMKHIQGDVQLVDRSDEYSLLAVQGRDAYELVVQLADQDLSGLEYYNFVPEGSMQGIPMIIARTGYTGERGFELYVRNEDALRLWDLLFSKGEGWLKPIGLGARDSLRLEMKFALYGNDIDMSTSTIEANLAWITRHRKKVDFLGKEVVLRHRNEGVDRLLVGFELLDRGIPRHGYECYLGDEKVGEVTSGIMSPMLNKPIGMAYLKPPHCEEGAEFEVEVRGRRLKARVVPVPFVQLEVPAR